MIFTCPYISPKFDFWKNFLTEVLRHLWKWKFISAYSSFFLHMQRIFWKCLSAYGEYGEFRVVCGTQSRLWIRGKYLCQNTISRYSPSKEAKWCSLCSNCSTRRQTQAGCYLPQVESKGGKHCIAGYALSRVIQHIHSEINFA